MRQRNKKADSGKDAKGASEWVAEIVPPQNDAPVWLKLDIINPVFKQTADCFKAWAVDDSFIGRVPTLASCYLLSSSPIMFLNVLGY